MWRHTCFSCPGWRRQRAARLHAWRGCRQHRGAHSGAVCVGRSWCAARVSHSVQALQAHAGQGRRSWLRDGPRLPVLPRLLECAACTLPALSICSKLFPEWVKKHELQQAAAAAAAIQQAAQEQAEQEQAVQQPPAAAAAGLGQPQGAAAAADAAAGQQALLQREGAALQAPQWSNYLVGAAAVAAAGVAATLLMKPPDGA